MPFIEAVSRCISAWAMVGRAALLQRQPPAARRVRLAITSPTGHRDRQHDEEPSKVKTIWMIRPAPDGQIPGDGGQERPMAKCQTN